RSSKRSIEWSPSHASSEIKGRGTGDGGRGTGTANNRTHVRPNGGDALGLIADSLGCEETGLFGSLELWSAAFTRRLQAYHADATFSPFRAFRPDPACIRVCSRQHRGRVCDGNAAAVHQVSEDRAGIGDRAIHSHRACEGY